MGSREEQCVGLCGIIVCLEDNFVLAHNPLTDQRAEDGDFLWDVAFFAENDTISSFAELGAILIWFF